MHSYCFQYIPIFKLENQYVAMVLLRCPAFLIAGGGGREGRGTPTKQMLGVLQFLMLPLELLLRLYCSYHYLHDYC